MKVHLVLWTVAVTQGLRLSPVTCVVELLKDLAEKTENDMNKSESLYEDFVWGKIRTLTVVAVQCASDVRLMCG